MQTIFQAVGDNFSSDKAIKYLFKCRVY